MDREQEIENVARAFCALENVEQTWDEAPEDVKERFRSLARAAIALAESDCDDPPDITDPCHVPRRVGEV